MGGVRISGRNLVQRIEKQAVRYGPRIATAEVVTVERSGDVFLCRTGSGLIEASTVIFAIGIRDVGDSHLYVDEHQRTNLPGLYAIGDVIAGLIQISRATGQATPAATSLRNDLLAGSSRMRSTALPRPHDGACLPRTGADKIRAASTDR